MQINPEHGFLQYSGRIDWSDKSAPVFTFPASYIRMKFRGTGVKAVVENRRFCWNNYLGCIIDGQQTRLPLAESGKETLTLAENLEDAVHELTLFKRMDACHQFTFYGFELEDGGEILEPEPLPGRRIEVYGDSVSAGEVSEAVDYVGQPDPEHNGEYSNSYYSYAWTAARLLNAQLHDIAQGGISLLHGTGYFGAPVYYGMEEVYDKLRYDPEMKHLKEWDFSRYQPQVVIVAIGQNDNYPEDIMAQDYEGEAAQRWRSSYKAFVEKLRGIYPKATILLATTILQHDAGWDRAIDEVCGELADDKLHHFTYKRNGAGTPGHIRISEAEEMAQELAAYIESLGEEVWEA